MSEPQRLYIQIDKTNPALFILQGRNSVPTRQPPFLRPLCSPPTLIGHGIIQCLSCHWCGSLIPVPPGPSASPSRPESPFVKER